MLRWFLAWFAGGEEAAVPSPERERALLAQERLRLAEIGACYREFGFEDLSLGCRERLRQVRARIHELDEGGNAPPAPPEGNRG